MRLEYQQFIPLKGTAVLTLCTVASDWLDMQVFADWLGTVAVA
jgi:hypothetical protein